MAQPADIRMFIMANDTTYYYQDNSGVHTIVNPANYGDYALKELPANWQDIQIKYGRSETYYGLFRSVVGTFQFIKDGAAICRNIYFSKGIEGVAKVKIERRDPITWDYTTIYIGAIDFPASSAELSMFNAPLAEGGLPALLKANDGTKYTIPFDNDAINVYIDGNELLNNYRWGTSTPVAQNITLNIGGSMQDRSFGAFFIDKEADYSYATTGNPSDIQMHQGAFATGSTEQLNFFYKATIAQEYTVVFNPTDITYTNAAYVGGNSGAVRLRVKVLQWDALTNTASVAAIIFTDPFPLAVGQTKTTTYRGSITRSMAINDCLYVVYDVVTAAGATPTVGSWGFSYIQSDDMIDIGSKFRLDASATSSFRAHKLLSKLTDKLTAGAFTASSAFLSNPASKVIDSLPYQLVYTSGDALRNLVTSSIGTPTTPALYISIRDFFKDLFAHYLVGLGVNSSNQLIIEPFSYFFDANTPIFDLGEVNNWSIKPANMLFSTSFLYGYSDVNLDKLNVRDEFNAGASKKMPIVSIEANQQDIRSPFIASMYSIEYMRVNIGSKKTTDSENDNDTFILDVSTTTTTINFNYPGVSGTAYTLRRPNSTANTNGILSPDFAYNLALSPARSPLALSPLIDAAAYQRIGQSATFLAADKNALLVSDLGTGSIAENANQAIGTSYFCKPFIITFECEAPFNLMSLMTSSPNGYFYGTINDNGTIKTFEGHVMDIVMQPGKSQTMTWTLLATKNFDETQFLT